MVSKFKVGDRVIAKGKYTGGVITNVMESIEGDMYEIKYNDGLNDIYVYTQYDLELDLGVSDHIPEVKIKYFGLENMSQHGDWIDLRSAEDIALEKGDYHLIPLGVAMEIPRGYEAHIVPRSSTFSKYGVIQTNGMGIIDNEYNGDSDQWYMPVYATRTTVIGKGDRVCQFRLVKSMGEVEFVRVDNLGNHDRGGLGSTGK